MSFDDASLLSLFQLEAKTQSLKLTDGLIALESERSPLALEELMRAAHSLKGAARIVGHEGVAAIAHELEECFVAAQGGKLEISASQIDVLLRGIDFMAQAAQIDPEGAPTGDAARALEAMLSALRSIERGDPASASDIARANGGGESPPKAQLEGASYDTDRLLTLASEALVAARALTSTVESEGGHYRSDQDIERAFDALRTSFRMTCSEPPPALEALHAAVASVLATRRERAIALDAVSQRVSSAVSHLYEGVLDARMLPFGDGIVGLPRLVRDTARTLGREVTLVTSGETTPVDREVLRRLDAPLGHLIRNAVDHGIEPGHERLERGKSPRGTIRVEARHGGGRLLVSVQDDGRGLDFAAVRARVVSRGLAEAQAVAEMSDSELSHFLFLPGFTMRDEVTPISGRGVGLDAVQMSVREIGGDVRLVHPPSGGMRFDMQLPLTLSVIRALVVLIGGEPYAFPLARVHRIVRVESAELSSVEGRQHFTLDGRQVGLVWGHQLLDIASSAAGESMCVVVIGDHEATWGIIVDCFMGEQELVLRGLDTRLQKVQDIGGASLLPDGSPLLVLDVDDVMRTASTLAAGGRLDPMRKDAAPTKVAKRVLVVDDSLTVRELERKMIESLGYTVDVAVDGMDGWNAMRAGHYDLVVTDVDMPRMDGIELVTLIKRDPALKAIPVMIVSYKDRDEDRRRGLDAGADYYLTKGSFYDETMLRAIEDFIGAGT
jgi:two-component system sensor histidine kinase and response regulator WspE